MANLTIQANPVYGRVIQGRSHMTTEAKCPACGAELVYAHSDHHGSPGRWYGCVHLRAAHYEGNFITLVEIDPDAT